MCMLDTLFTLVWNFHIVSMKFISSLVVCPFLWQPILRTIISKVIIPIVNANLRRGFPLPVLPLVDLQNADVHYEEGYILICSDVYYKGLSIKPFNFSRKWIPPRRKSQTCKCAPEEVFSWNILIILWDVYGDGWERTNIMESLVQNPTSNDCQLTGYVKVSNILSQ